MPDEHYTHGHVDSVLRSHRWRNADNSARYLLPELHRRTSILDVGCGPGNITIDLARRVSPGRVVGLDSSKMVIAEAIARGADVDVDVEWQVGDVYRLPFAEGTFDVVHAHQVLQHLGDPVSALLEMKRVARVGGIVAARDSDYSSWSWFPDLPALDRWREMFIAVTRANAGEPEAGRYMVAWAHRAGFEEVRTSVTCWCFTTPEDVAWWSDIWAERVTGSPLAERAVELGIETEAGLEVIAEGWRRWAEHPDAYMSAPSTEILCAVRGGDQPKDR